MTLERSTKADLLTARITGDVPFIRNVVNFDVPQINTELMPIKKLPPYKRSQKYIDNLQWLMRDRTFNVDPETTQQAKGVYGGSMARYILNRPLYLITSPPAEHRMRREVDELYASQIVNFTAFHHYGNTIIEPVIETASGDQALLPQHHHVLGTLYVPNE